MHRDPLLRTCSIVAALPSDNSGLFSWAVAAGRLLGENFQLDIHPFAGRHAGTVCVAAHEAARNVAVVDEQEALGKLVFFVGSDGHFHDLPVLAR